MEDLVLWNTGMFPVGCCASPATGIVDTSLQAANWSGSVLCCKTFQALPCLSKVILPMFKDTIKPGPTIFFYFYANWTCILKPFYISRASRPISVSLARIMTIQSFIGAFCSVQNTIYFPRQSSAQSKEVSGKKGNSRRLVSLIAYAFFCPFSSFSACFTPILPLLTLVATQPNPLFFPWQLLSKPLILHCLVHETVRTDHGTVLMHQFILSQAGPESANVRETISMR